MKQAIFSAAVAAAMAAAAGGASRPAVGPRGPVGPNVPLTDGEKRHLARRIAVDGRTSAAVQAACDRAAKDGCGTVFLPAGQYVLEKQVRVPGGLTVLGEGAKTLCRPKDRSVHLFRAEGDAVRFTRLKLQGAAASPSTNNNSYGITVSGRRDVRIDHCELLGFSYATNFGSEATAQVDHCVIHHNLRGGLGYGVAIYSGAYVLVADNEFRQNRHSLASNGALDWGSPKRLGRYVHKPGVRKTHWEFIHNRVGSNDESRYELCAVDTHPGMDGTFVVEANVFEDLRHAVGIRDGSGLIRGNVFRNLRTVTGFRARVGVSISYGRHNNVPVEGCMPHDVVVKDNLFTMKEGVKYRKWVVGKAENIVIDGRLVPETRAKRPPVRSLPRLVPMGPEGKLAISRRQLVPEPPPTTKAVGGGDPPNPQIGYRKLKPGTVRVWDTRKKYTQKNPMGAALKDKPSWRAVPYGQTEYQPRGDLMLENDFFYLFLFTNKEDAVDLMAKMVDGGVEGHGVATNEIYKVHDTGRRNFGHGTMWVKVRKYAPGEIVVDHAGQGMRTGKPLPIVTTYRVLAGKCWLEVRPVERVNQQGMHGKSRICAFVNRDSDELILDSKRATWTGERNIHAPPDAIGIINFHRRFRKSTYDFMWFLTAGPGFEKSKLTYLGFHADRFWADEIPHDAPSCGAQYVHMKDKVVIGVLNRRDIWKREDVLRPIVAGASYTSAFAAPYPGKWRLIGFVVEESGYKPRPRVASPPIPASFGVPIRGRYHCATVEIRKPGEHFTFKSPVKGTLDYLLMYMLDRTERTGPDVFTPMEIYRQAVAATSSRAGEVRAREGGRSKRSRDN